MHSQRTPVLHATDKPATAGGAASAGDLLVAFDGYLARQGRAPGTRDRYQRVLTNYTTWLSGTSPAAVAADVLDRYLDHWQTTFTHTYGRPAALASYRGQINALRSFYTYLDRFSLLTDADGRALPDPTRRIPCPPAPQSQNDWLRPAEDHALQTCPGSLPERFPILLLRHTGIRIGEACALTLADLDLTEGREALTVRNSKTHAGRRTIPIVPDLAPHLAQWLDQLASRGLDTPSTPLLATRHGTPMKDSFLWRLVKRLAHRAGVRPIHCTCHTTKPPHESGCPQTRNGFNLSHVTPHTLRRTFATDLLNRGLRLEVVSKLLGHASTTVTERAYAQLLDDTTRRELLNTLKPAA